MYLRISRYYRNKDAMKNFLEEDPNTLEFRNSVDKIQEIHSANYCNYAILMLKQNKTKEALEKIQDGLDKIDHRHLVSNLIKVQILRVMNKYDEAKDILNSLASWHPDAKDQVDAKLSEIAIQQEQETLSE